MPLPATTNEAPAGQGESFRTTSTNQEEVAPMTVSQTLDIAPPVAARRHIAHPEISDFLTASAAIVRTNVWDRGYGPNDIPRWTGLSAGEANARWTDGRWTVENLVNLADGIGMDFLDLFNQLPFPFADGAR